MISENDIQRLRERFNDVTDKYESVDDAIKDAYAAGEASARAEAKRFQERAEKEIDRWSKPKSLGIGFACGAIVALILTSIF